MLEAVLRKVETYISCRQNIAAQYIENRPIVDLFLAEKTEDGAKGGKEVVGTGRSVYGGDSDGGLGAEQEEGW